MSRIQSKSFLSLTALLSTALLAGTATAATQSQLNQQENQVAAICKVSPALEAIVYAQTECENDDACSAETQKLLNEMASELASKELCRSDIGGASW